MISKKLFIFVCLAVALVYAHGASHTVEVSSTLYKQLKNYIETNFSSKYTQVAISVFIVSFPSIPVFFGLSLLGRTLKKKGDKHNFSAKLLNILLSFSCGTLLGDLMLHILPYLYGIGHSHEQHSHEHDKHHHSNDNTDQSAISLMIILGVVIFIVIEFMCMNLHNHDNQQQNTKQSKQIQPQKGKDSSPKKHEHNHSHGHDHKDVHMDKNEHSAIPFLFGDFLHNFCDGIALGAAYSVNLQMGLMSTFVIMLHELPHEIGDFAHLITYNYSLNQIMKTQLLTSTGALIGGFFGLLTGSIYEKELLCITAGGFFYMCFSQILPEIIKELKNEHTWRNLFLIILSFAIGVGCMYYVTLLE